MNHHRPGRHEGLDTDLDRWLGASSVSPDSHATVGFGGALFVRLISGEGVCAEQMLDRETLADLVHEAIEQSQRTRGVGAQTTWQDAVEAANLILFHVTRLASDPPPEV